MRISQHIHTAILALVLGLVAYPAFARSAPDSFADLVDKLSPAVVNISTTQTLTRDDLGDLPDLQLPPGSPFEQFFRDYMDRQQNTQRPRKATALGSGFIVDPAGYIVTNNHVIDGADEISVTLDDDSNYTAKLVGRDKKTDLALLKIEAKKPLPSTTWGDSNKARVGDWVVAIGDPFGLGGTVTAGIISARARNINSGPYDDYLQTDAPINRGNSGGPMFNMNGEVIGVNTAIISPNGGSIGLGFAIPSDIAKNIIDQLKTAGHIRRGWLGVQIQNVSKEIAAGLGMPEAKGALISGVSKDGPAEKAGVKVGDVVINFDGKDVPEMRRLPLIVAGTEVNKSTSLTVIRKGQTVNLTVKVGEYPNKDEDSDDDTLPHRKEKPVDATQGDKIDDLGLTVSSLNSNLRKKYGIGKTVNGVVVTAMTPDSLAGDLGVTLGDVISQAGQEDVQSAKDLRERAAAAKKAERPLLLLINRKDDVRFIAIPFGKQK